MFSKKAIHKLAGPERYYAYIEKRKAKWDKGDRSPIAASLKLTWRCNLNCAHCFWKQEPKTAELGTKEWKKIIRRLAGQGCIEVILEGGEPTLREDFYELVSYAKEQMLWVDVVSNGQKALRPLGIHKLWISIDGMQQSHDRLRGKGTWQKAVQNIENYEHKDELYLLVSLNTYNKTEIAELMAYFKDRVAGFWFSFAYRTPGLPDIELKPEEKAEMGSFLLTNKKNHTILNMDAFLRDAGKGKACRHWLLATVLADGTMARDCYPRHFEGIGCASCELACYRDLDASLYAEKR